MRRKKRWVVDVHQEGMRRSRGGLAGRVVFLFLPPVFFFFLIPVRLFSCDPIRE